MINFPHDIAEPVERFGTSQTFMLVRADSLDADQLTLNRIASICNEHAIYRWLFAELLDNKPYTTSDAKNWIDWACRGWAEETHFVFAVLDVRGGIAAACDIKSNCTTDAEIGYWCCADASGVMTNSVRAMLRLASGAGFRSFIAYTRAGNAASESVLRRLGFSSVRSAADDGRTRHHLYAC